MIKITECPRDAMQGLHEFIPTEKKINYINQLLQVGFDTIDFGSFVSPKAIPQMRDTADVLKKLHLTTTTSKLLAIVANKKGAEDACAFHEISYLGFPFSISETFQKRNTNSSIEESLLRVDEIQRLCIKHEKQLVVYLSMAFGNPYGDKWNPEIAIKWSSKLGSMGINLISLADTIGVSTPENIKQLFIDLIPEFNNIQFSAHLHSRIETSIEKIKSAYEAGCKRFDSAIKGFGGCPMAKDELTGNIATEQLLSFFNELNVETGVNQENFNTAYKAALNIFPN
jgi:hydroxymethylglutaryl-CoA lyase